jgi:hypothetical protein
MFTFEPLCVQSNYSISWLIGNTKNVVTSSNLLFRPLNEIRYLEASLSRVFEVDVWLLQLRYEKERKKKHLTNL